MTTEVRSIRSDELPAFLDALTTGFNDRPDLERLTGILSTIWDLGRTRATFEDGRIVGTFRSWPTEITVPGGAIVPASGILAVTVLPTHRRRGILTRLITTEHAAIRERGEVLGVLYASEYPIYGRFGYGPATREGSWRLDLRSTRFHGEPDREAVELVAPGTAIRDEMAAMFDSHRRQQNGAIKRRDSSWDFDLGLRPMPFDRDWKGFLAVHREVGGRLDGYVRYSFEDTWEDRQPRNVAKVDDLQALTTEAWASLWRYLGGLDWVAAVEAERRSPSERLPWLLTNARAARLFDVGDGLWLRIVHVRRALEARTYAGDDRLVIEVVDRVEPKRTERVSLDTGRGGATCRPSRRSPDLTVDLAALGAAYLGGPRLGAAALAFGVEEHRPGAVARLERLLHLPDEPWCSTFF